MTLLDAKIGEARVVASVGIDDAETKAFLFTLGCYDGQSVTVISKKKSTMVVAFKDARYTIDNELARTIVIKE